MNAQELVTDVSPRIADVGYRYYFAPETEAVGEDLGLDLFSFYFLGRGGVLGDVEWPVVAAAFGYFNPEVISMMWNGARRKLAPRDAARRHLGCCAEFGRRHLAAVEGLEAFCAAAEAVHGAAQRSIAALPLYAGMAAEPIPEDLPARAMHLVAMLREHRGSVHLVAVVAAGLDPAVAHYLRRPTDWRLFGWTADQAPTVTDIDRRRLADVDATTDRLVAPAYAVLDDAGGRALSGGLGAVQAALGEGAGAPRRG
ncbi:MAG: hypothetical protein M3Y36_01225 [Actinomycetota bacterium]|nr:hypothetical protein [Actinomycetota bacterium]